MLIFYRIVPWISSAIIAVGFLAMWRFQSQIFLIFIALCAVIAFLYWVFVDIAKTQYGFWHFLFSALCLLFSGFLFLIFFEENLSAYVLTAIVTLLHFAFAETAFFYFHQPSKYRINTIERISGVLYVMSNFFFMSAMFGFLILVHLPLWLLSPVVFIYALFIIYGMLWVSKINRSRGVPYALSGAFAFTQIFVALSFLPVAHTTNSAFMTVFLYLFLGLSRADFLDRLTKSVFIRYFLAAVVIVGCIILIAKWV
jgi:hypothetical protein